MLLLTNHRWSSSLVLLLAMLSETGFSFAAQSEPLRAGTLSSSNTITAEGQFHHHHRRRLRRRRKISSLASTTRRNINNDATSSVCNTYSNVLKQVLTGVCVCNATQCHELPPMPTVQHGSSSLPSAVLFTTSEAGRRFEPELLNVHNGTHRWTSSWSTGGLDAIINVTTQAGMQSILGFGGSWTDSAAIGLYKMNPQIQQSILQAYYGPNGLQYTLARIPIASADFSPSIYSYNDLHPGDFNMEHFSIDNDLPPISNKIPMIQRALNMSERPITIFASPWAPPVWMTTANTTLNCDLPGYPDGTSPHWKAWALYFSKFLSAYDEQGIHVNAVTVQNEPVRYKIVPVHWQSLRINSTTARDFVKFELGPRLRADHPDVQIVIMDDQKPNLATYTSPTLDDPEAAQYVSGVGFHWYLNLAFAVPSFIPGFDGDFDKLASHHQRYPNIYLLATEACEGAFPVLGTGYGPKITKASVVWQRAVNYARDIIGDLQNYAVGWTDWNILLDLGGGPNWAGNYVDAPILVDVESGEEFYKQPMYYIMGHFSKYIEPGSIRLPISLKNKDPLVEMVAFLTPDRNQVVLVMQNRRQFVPRKFRFRLTHGDMWVQGTLDANSVATLIIPLSN